MEKEYVWKGGCNDEYGHCDRGPWARIALWVRPVHRYAVSRRRFEVATTENLSFRAALESAVAFTPSATLEPGAIGVCETSEQTSAHQETLHNVRPVYSSEWGRVNPRPCKDRPAKGAGRMPRP